MSPRFVAFALVILSSAECPAQLADLAPAQTIVTWPDATPTTVSPTSVTAGNNITISPRWAVRNSGPAAATRFDVGVYLSRDAAISSSTDKRIGGLRNQSLNSGQSAFLPTSCRVPADVAPGTYNIAILVDETDSVQETDELNNALVIVSELVVNAPVNVDLRPRVPRIAAGNSWESVAFGNALEVAHGGTLYLLDWR